MSAIPKTNLTPEDYLEFERKSEERHEYFDGEIIAKSSANRNHCIINVNIGAMLWRNFKGKSYEAYLNKIRVFVPATGLYTYPFVGSRRAAAKIEFSAIECRIPLREIYDKIDFSDEN